MQNKRIFSGIQPTGNLHLGNYLGALKNWVRLQDEYQCIYCVVDMHAITIWQNPDELKSAIREVAAGMIASGVDTSKHILFNQSKVPAHAQLTWIFNCVARMGWMTRMIQFKEKAGKNSENVSVGLFDYPCLMAADILLYKATHVPVGEDQKQHIELARDIAVKFNNDFKTPFFPIPEPLIIGPATRVMSLRDGSQKMSKSEVSDMSRINMFDDNDAIVNKIKKAKTDAEPFPQTLKNLEGRPEAQNLFNIYAAITNKSLEKIITEMNGKQFSDFKKILADALVAELEPINNNVKRLLKDTAYIDNVLKDGAERANAIAEPILRQVYDIVGFI